MIASFPEEDLKGRATAPWTEDSFKVAQDSPPLSKERAEQFHTTTAQGLFVCKRGRPDISPAIAFLTTRVRASTEEDWSKLSRMMKFLKLTAKDRLTLRADGKFRLYWHVDAAFAVHPDYRSHTGAALTMGEGAITSISRKQTLNTRSSTGAEIVGVDDAVGPMLWSGLFLDAQGYPVEKNILYQDNQSAILLANNGRRSAGKRSRHINIRFFFITDQIDKGRIAIECCPTDQMVSDHMTKPVVGKKFTEFRRTIMNLPDHVQFCMLAFIGAAEHPIYNACFLQD